MKWHSLQTPGKDSQVNDIIPAIEHFSGLFNRFRLIANPKAFQDIATEYIFPSANSETGETSLRLSSGAKEAIDHYHPGAPERYSLNLVENLTFVKILLK